MTEHPPLTDLIEDSRDCRRCPLYRLATQTVFGEGPSRAPVMLVGEQPGDQEDLRSQPDGRPVSRANRRSRDRPCRSR